MTLKEWDIDAEGMTDAELESRIKAIAELQLWPAFKREFGWTGFHALLFTLQNEQSARKHKSEQLQDARFKRIHSTDEAR